MALTLAAAGCGQGSTSGDYVDYRDTREAEVGSPEESVAGGSTTPGSKASDPETSAGGDASQPDGSAAAPTPDRTSDSGENDTPDAAEGATGTADSTQRDTPAHQTPEVTPADSDGAADGTATVADSGQVEAAAGETDAAAGTAGTDADDVAAPTADTDGSAAGGSAAGGSAAGGAPAEPPATGSGGNLPDDVAALMAERAALLGGGDGLPGGDPTAAGGAPAEPRPIRLLIPEKRFRSERGTDAIRVSYDDIDLLKVLNMEPVPRDAVDHFPDWLLGLDGRKIRIRGFMFPTFQATGITQFTLARDNGICCFVRKPKIYDIIAVELADGESTDYIEGRPFDVEGVFRIDPEADETELFRLYRIENATVLR